MTTLLHASARSYAALTRAIYRARVLPQRWDPSLRGRYTRPFDPPCVCVCVFVYSLKHFHIASCSHRLAFEMRFVIVWVHVNRARGPCVRVSGCGIYQCNTCSPYFCWAIHSPRCRFMLENVCFMHTRAHIHIQCRSYAAAVADDAEDWRRTRGFGEKTK